MTCFVKRISHIIYFYKVDICSSGKIEHKRIFLRILIIERAECAIGSSVFLTFVNYLHYSYRITCSIANHLIRGAGIRAKTYRYICLRRHYKAHLFATIKYETMLAVMPNARSRNKLVILHIERIQRHVILIVRTGGCMLNRSNEGIENEISLNNITCIHFLARAGYPTAECHAVSN